MTEEEALQKNELIEMIECKETLAYPFPLKKKNFKFIIITILSIMLIAVFVYMILRIWGY